MGIAIYGLYFGYHKGLLVLSTESEGVNLRVEWQNKKRESKSFHFQIQRISKHLVLLCLNPPHRLFCLSTDLLPNAVAVVALLKYYTCNVKRKSKTCGRLLYFIVSAPQISSISSCIPFCS